MAKVRFTEEDVNRGKAFDEPAWVRVEITKHEEVPAKTDGSKLWKYQYKVLEGKYKGSTIFDQFSEKAMSFMINFAKATAGPDVIGPKGSLKDFDTDQKGKTLEVYVKPEPYEGKMQNKVKDYRPVGAGRA